MAEAVGKKAGRAKKKGLKPTKKSCKNCWHGSKKGCFGLIRASIYVQGVTLLPDNPFYMADFSPSQSQERERLKIQYAQAELSAQLCAEPAPRYGTCPTQARERHQARMAIINALCASVQELAQHA